MQKLISVFVALLVFGCISDQYKEPSANLTDEDLLNYAKSFNESKESMVFDNFILGYHQGVPVRAWFPCSDICPDYTVMVLHYNISIEECESINGSVTTLYIPVGIAASMKDFCVPKVLTDNGFYVPNNITNAVNQSPFFYVDYKNDDELKQLRGQLKEFGGCNVYNKEYAYTYPYYLNKIGRLGRGTFDMGSNCTAHELWKTQDPELIRHWFAQTLVENADITGVTDPNVLLNFTIKNWYGADEIRIDISTGPQKIAGYDSNLGGISGVIYLSTYNGTEYYSGYFYGSNYPEPNVSIQPRISLAEAKVALIEQYQAITCPNAWCCHSSIAGPQCYSLNETLNNMLTEKDLLTEDEEQSGTATWPKSTLKILVQENDLTKRFEYKLVWDIWLKRNCENNAYVDAITGELLSVNDYCMY